MRFYEYEVKKIFKEHGIPVPRGKVASNPAGVREIARHLGKPVVLKAQVLVGGRCKAGGIRFADNPEEAEREAERLFGLEISGFRVNKILVEEKLNVSDELYLGIAVDSARGAPVVMASSEGGVDIEEVAERSPEKIVRLYPNILRGVREYETRKLIKRIGLRGQMLTRVSRILYDLYKIFREYDAEIVEINPLVITEDGEVFAADARLNVDDHSLYRHPELKALSLERIQNSLERRGREVGMNFVDLKGNIAVAGSGAGLTMFLLDAIASSGGRPACFLDIGGGMSVERVENAFRLLLMKADSDPDVKVIFFAFWFMISPAEEATEGLLRVLAERKPKIPIIGVIQGVGAEKAVEILERAGIRCYSTIKEGVKAAVEVAGKWESS